MASPLHIHILGCYAAAPGSFKNPTAQVVNMRNHIMLVDCGEGTQVALRRYKVKFSRIKYVFISHLHGDHIFGLMGVITTFSLLKRATPLTIYGPVGIKELVLTQLKLTKGFTSYPLHFIELSAKSSELILENDQLEVHTIPLKHRIYTNGFLFREKPGDRKLDINACLNLDIDKAYFRKIKQGGDYTTEDGTVIPNEALTSAPDPIKSYAYCSDTAYSEAIIPLVDNATVLYHESTFLESHAHLCKITGHSTAKQAATIAQKAKVGTLILGHYSTRYKELPLFEKEATTIFPNVKLADDGKTFTF